MTRALSQDLRSRVLAAIGGGLSCNAAAKRLASRYRVRSAYPGDRERPIQSIVNTGSGDHEHPIALA
jgi:hypothetical protein